MELLLKVVVVWTALVFKDSCLVLERYIIRLILRFLLKLKVVDGFQEGEAISNEGELRVRIRG